MILSTDFLLEKRPFYSPSGFGEVFALLRKVPVGDKSITTQQIRDLGHSDDEMEVRRNAHQFLRSSLKTKDNLNILTQARSPAEAWLNLESGTILEPSPQPRPCSHVSKCIR